jgi:hypothetical protein
MAFRPVQPVASGQPNPPLGVDNPPAATSEAQTKPGACNSGQGRTNPRYTQTPLAAAKVAKNTKQSLSLKVEACNSFATGRAWPLPANFVPRKPPAKQNAGPVKLPAPVLKGTYGVVDSIVTWQGDWGMSADAFQKEGQTSSFNYRKKGNQTALQQSLPLR